MFFTHFVLTFIFSILYKYFTLCDRFLFESNYRFFASILKFVTMLIFRPFFCSTLVSTALLWRHTSNFTLTFSIYFLWLFSNFLTTPNAKMNFTITLKSNSVFINLKRKLTFNVCETKQNNCVLNVDKSVVLFAEIIKL